MHTPTTPSDKVITNNTIKDRTIEPGMHNIDFKQCYKLGLEKELYFICVFIFASCLFFVFVENKVFKNKVLMSDFIFAIL